MSNQESNTLIRLPNWLGDVVMALPVIRAMHRQGQHRITLLAQPHFKPFLERLDCFDNVIYLPPKGWAYYFKLWSIRKNTFDKQVLFTYSERTDIEARIIAAKARFGILRQGKKRPLLTHHFPLSDEFNEVHIHQTRLFTAFAHQMGLIESSDISLEPLVPPQTNDSKYIGLICGTENTPAKRWPVSHWVKLINAFTHAHPEYTLLLLGTAKDKAITDEVEHAITPEAKRCTQNIAGQTNLSGFMDKLQNCAAVICNDTGGMHLANGLGVPVISLFGPTNPVRTGPIFAGAGTVLQPEGAPATGNVNISGIGVDAVLTATQQAIRLSEYV